MMKKTKRRVPAITVLLGLFLMLAVFIPSTVHAADTQDPVSTQDIVANVAPVASQGMQRIYSVTEMRSAFRNQVTIRVETGVATTYTWVQFDGNRYQIGRLMSEAAGRRVWEITYRPAIFDRHSVQVSANREYVWHGAVSVVVEVLHGGAYTPTGSPAITSIRANPTTINPNQTSVITVRTNQGVTHVWTYVDGRRINGRATANATGAGNSRTFTFQVAPSATQTLEVFANSANTPNDAYTRDIDVTVRDESAIISEASAIWNNAGTQIQVTVVTNRATDWVDLQVPGRSGRLNFADRSDAGNTTTWTIIYTPPMGWNHLPITAFAGTQGGGNEVMRRITETENDIMHPPHNANPIISVSLPEFRQVASGTFEAVLRVVTTANTEQLSVRSIDTGRNDFTITASSFQITGQNSREWRIVVPISPSVLQNSTRFLVEAIGRGGILPNGSYTTRTANFRPYFNEPVFIAIPTPVITRLGTGNYEAVFTIETTAAVDSLFIRAIDTGNNEVAGGGTNFVTIGYNRRLWNIPVTIRGNTPVSSTRFNLEASGHGGLLRTGSHTTAPVRFRDDVRENAFVSVSHPVITRLNNGSFEASFVIVTTADVDSLAIRTLDTGNMEQVEARTGFITTAPNRRQWVVVVPIMENTLQNSTRFHIESRQGGILLPGGTHTTELIRFRA